jgi:succinate dehydrogenase/fumarate reductase flavoprotein subunit
MPIETEWRDVDVVVIGSGGAGGAAAHAASEAGASVLVVSKDPIGCSDTKISEGIIAVRGSGEESDTEEALSENLRVAGGDLPDPEITEAFAEDTEAAYDLLRRQGLRPAMDDKSGTAKTLPIALGGHTHRRSIGHKNGGVAFGHANWNAIIEGAGIDYLEDAWFLDAVTIDGEDGPQVVGAVIYDAARGKFVAVRAKAVVVASGGLNTLFFPKTDGMRGNTGDSFAVAARAGADLIDMEQLQFLPFCITYPPAYEGLLAGEPATAGFLGVLRDAHGKLILDGVMLRTRAECSAAIVRAVADGNGTERGGCYLDLTANVKAPRSGPYFETVLNNALPRVMSTVRQAMGKKAAKCQESWEVRPGAHYMMGGVRVNADCVATTDEGRAPVRGLFAAGQAMGGLFGSNRLGSTSLSEGAIFGRRAGISAAATDSPTGSHDTAIERIRDSYTGRLGRGGGDNPSVLIRELQKECWDKIGPARTRDGLEALRDRLSALRARADNATISNESLWNQSFIDHVELTNMLESAEAMMLASLDRAESLGGHVRLDGRQASVLFDKPRSVVMRRDADGAWLVGHVDHPKTPPRQMIAYLYHDQVRKLKLRAIRLLPISLQDRILERRYVATMGRRDAPEAVTEGASA